MSDTAIKLWMAASIVLLIAGVISIPLCVPVIGLVCSLMAVFCLNVHEDAVYVRELEELEEIPPPPVMDG